MRGAPNPVFDKLTDRNLAVAEVVHEVAQSVGRTPAQVALNWVCTQPGVTSSIIGASKLAQLEDNLSALDFTIPDALRVRLSDASRLPTEYPYVFYSEALQGMVRAGTNVLPEPRTFRPRIT
jgi:aryl-alcohol dehydrogenase-like predicted oxidoreductase